MNDINKIIGLYVTNITLLEYFNTSIYVERLKSNKYLLRADKNYLLTTRYKKIIEVKEI